MGLTFINVFQIGNENLKYNFKMTVYVRRVKTHRIGTNGEIQNFILVELL